MINNIDLIKPLLNFSEESKQKMSNKRKGIIISDEVKLNMSKGMLGKTKSKSHKENIAKSKLGEKNIIMPKCKICQEEIHPKRVALGYKTTCTKHSTAEKYSGIITATNKSDYELAIIKDPELAKQLKELSPVYE